MSEPGASSEYKVRLEIFEGPLDLLLHLIKSNELEVSEISISQITSQYLDYLRLMEQLDLEVAGEYLVVAATLLNIKLRSLLPAPEEEAEEDAEEVDDFMSARMLMQRLIEYRKFKEAGQDLRKRYDYESLVFVREVALPKLAEAQADPDVRGDVEKLLEAFMRVLRFVDRGNYHQIDHEEYHVDDKLMLLRRQMMLEDTISLNGLFERCHAKQEMIVTLMALLELCRLKEVRLSQPDNFTDVLIYRREGSEDPDMVDQADENAELARTEQEILAQRTGVVDDGIIPDDEDQMIDEALAAADAEMTAAMERMEQAGGETAADETEPAADSEVEEIEDTEEQEDLHRLDGEAAAEAAEADSEPARIIDMAAQEEPAGGGPEAQ